MFNAGAQPLRHERQKEESVELKVSENKKKRRIKERAQHGDRPVMSHLRICRRVLGETENGTSKQTTKGEEKRCTTSGVKKAKL